MPRNLTSYNLLFSCPGDAYAECYSVIKDAVEDFNKYSKSSLSIDVDLTHWSTDSYPQSGGHPQTLLNTQIVDSADAAIAIFWTRFGTPTDEYGSGTEEEIERLINHGKQVFLYFLDKAVPPSVTDSDIYREQRKQISAFQKRYEGIYCVVSDELDLKEQFSKHLFLFFAKQVSKEINFTSDNVEMMRKRAEVIKGLDDFIHSLEISNDSASFVSLSDAHAMELDIKEALPPKRVTYCYMLDNAAHSSWIDTEIFLANAKQDVRYYLFAKSDNDADIILSWIKAIAEKHPDLLNIISRSIEIRVLEGATLSAEFFVFNWNTDEEILLLIMQDRLSGEKQIFQIKDKNIEAKLLYKIQWLADYCRSFDVFDYLAGASVAKDIKPPQNFEWAIANLLNTHEETLET